nr:hypothetical protein [Paenibacillus larvae]
MDYNCYSIAGCYRHAFYHNPDFGEKADFTAYFFEYITGITLGELAGFISTDIENNYFLGALALFVWFLVPFLLEMTTLKSKKLREWFDGKGTVLIKEEKYSKII